MAPLTGGLGAMRRPGAVFLFSLLLPLVFSTVATSASGDVTPNDPKFTSQYAPQLLHAPTAWATTTGTSVATICLIDSGVRRTHEDLAAHYAGGIDLVNGDADPQDDRGHGTRTAGVAAAVIGNGKGIAGMANVPFLSVKIIDGQGVVRGDVATAIRWCADHGAKIVSMSFAGAGAESSVLAAIDYAWSKGLLLVAGTGNGACNDCVMYPAAFDRVIAVGCVDSARATCSSQSKGPEVDLAAPGTNVLTTGYGSDGAYVYGGGTSISAPHVAGAAALVWSARPSWTNAQVRQALEATAQDLGAAGRDASSGFGLVRPDLAIAYGTSTPFTASFAPASGINEWWIDVKVTSAAAPTKVEARVDGAGWTALAKTSWGTWAKSVYAPRGSAVEFRATDAAGATVTSAPFQWMGAPAFAATFTPKSQTNNWWVEATVTANAAVAKVEAREDGGAWVALPATSWGTYAKSLHIEDGHRVEFRATSGSGATATSASYTWG